MQADKPSVHNNLGLSYFEKNEMEQAIQEFNKAIKLERSSVHFNNLGLAYFHNKQIDEALENFSEALELNTIGDPTIYFNRGNAYLSENKFEEALDDFERASKIAPQNPKYHHAKGITYEALSAKVEKEFGKFKRFDHEKLSIEMRFASELVAYLREDFLKYSNQAI
jgi:tetratricopeptide (TPR) repeat protein